MRRLGLVAMLAMAASAARAEVPTEKIRLDTMVVERVIEASHEAKKSVPQDILRKIASDTVQNLRGPKPDGTYDFAYYDRFEAGRRSESCSVQVTKEGEFDGCQANGDNIYRIIVEVPSRRLLVARNRKLWVERIDLDYIPQGSSVRKQASIAVKAWFEPSSTSGFDLPEIARQVTAKVISRADAESGYGNVLVTVIEARVIDDARSPYANAVTRAKGLQRTIDRGESDEIRNAAIAVRDALPVSSPGVAAGELSANNVYMELQDIEDLLMGSTAEREQGMERLRQLRRRVRPR